MKKILIVSAILIVTVIVAAVILTFALREEKVILEGTYSDVLLGTGRILEFDGENVTLTYMSADKKVFSSVGTYEVKNDLIVFYFEDSSASALMSGESMFEIKDDGIIIDGSVYKKTE